LNWPIRLRAQRAPVDRRFHLIVCTARIGISDRLALGFASRIASPGESRKKRLVERLICNKILIYMKQFKKSDARAALSKGNVKVNPRGQNIFKGI
jgi:hypothetical protein